MAKPGRGGSSRRSHFEQRARDVQNGRNRTIDDLIEFEEFRNSTLKAIRKDIKNGLSAEEIRKKYLAILQGRLITDALTTDNSALAATIVKDVADRVEGKATERKEIKHRLENLSEQELDAVLKSEEQELEEMQARFSKDN